MNFNSFKRQFNESQAQLFLEVKAYPWSLKSAYTSWLANTYYYVQNSTRILALAAGTMDSDKTIVSSRFIRHAAEETGHERLLINDVRSLGSDMTQISVTTEMKFYLRSLYYWVSPAGNPLGLMGWILSLEGLAAGLGPDIYAIAKQTYGLESSTFLKVHADEDPNHLDKALKLLSPLHSRELELVADSLQSYSAQYVAILRAICTQSAEVSQAA